MQQAEELLQLVHDSQKAFEKITEAEWASRPAPQKWSKKEILGHLADSAQNNLRRFIVTQYKPNDRIFYLQDEWVKAQAYQDMPVGEIIQLWQLLNRQVARVLNHLSKEALYLTCDTGKNTPEPFTLEFLIDDYLVHLKHHLAQIKGK